jgi:hypothetical protein
VHQLQREIILGAMHWIVYLYYALDFSYSFSARSCFSLMLTVSKTSLPLRPVSFRDLCSQPTFQCELKILQSNANRIDIHLFAGGLYVL